MKPKHMICLVFAETTHVVAVPHGFACVVLARDIVMYTRFHQNLFKGFGDTGNFPFPITLAVLFLAATILDFQNIRNFNALSPVKCQYMSPYFIQIHQTVVGIWRLNGFQNGGCSLSWFLKFKFFNARMVKRPIMHYHANFREDWSNHCWHIGIFVIVKMVTAPSWIFLSPRKLSQGIM